MKNVILAGLAAALLLPAQQKVEIPIDNDQVKVLKVWPVPHRKGRLHEHQVNRVMIYLGPGTETLEYEDGRKAPLRFQAGEVQWSAAGGKHTSEVTSDAPFSIVEIELKKPGNKALSIQSALDPVKIDPKHYKVEFENDQVRVVRVHFGPHESTPVHEHTVNRVVTFLTDQDFRVTGPDGKVQVVRNPAGSVVSGGPTQHKEENASDKPCDLWMVELKM